MSEAARSIYMAYPRKVAPTAALKAITKALKTVQKEKDFNFFEAHNYLLRATMNYAKAMEKEKKEKRFIPYAQKWFNSGRYDDEQGEWEEIVTQHNNEPTQEWLEKVWKAHVEPEFHVPLPENAMWLDLPSSIQQELLPLWASR